MTDWRWIDSGKKENESVNQRHTEWDRCVNEWIDAYEMKVMNVEWTKERTDNRMYKWTNELTNEKMKKRTNKKRTEGVSITDKK